MYARRTLAPSSRVVPKIDREQEVEAAPQSAPESARSQMLGRQSSEGGGVTRFMSARLQSCGPIPTAPVQREAEKIRNRKFAASGFKEPGPRPFV